MEREENSQRSSEARRYVWMGAIPIQLQLHTSEVTSLPAPPAILILAPRNGYLPLLVDTIKPHFQSSLPPGADTLWFDYEGLPLKWHIPTGVLFDLLCAEPERPWNLTVHFREYPSEMLSSCEGEETVKWNFFNTLKEASYVMYGNTKGVMNLSQMDQSELWKSVVKGDIDNYDHVSMRLKPGFSTSSAKTISRRSSGGESSSDSHNLVKAGSEYVLPGRVPLRIYVRYIKDDNADFDNVPIMESWGEVAYMTRPIEIRKEEGMMLTLGDALWKVVPHLFSGPSTAESVDNNVGDNCEPQKEVDASRTKELAKEIETATERTVLDDKGDVTKLPTDDPSSGYHRIEREAPDPSSSSVSDEKWYSAPQAVLQGADRNLVSENVRQSSSSEAILYKSDKSASASEIRGVLRMQGIEPSLDLPLDWIARNLCGPEQFLHLCICMWTS